MTTRILDTKRNVYGNAIILLTLLINFAFTIPISSAQQETPTFDPNPIKPADTSSPRNTLRSYLADMDKVVQAWSQGQENKQVFRAALRAMDTLDFSTTVHSDSWEVRTERLLLLQEVLNRIKIPPLDEIPGDTEVSQGSVSHWSIPNTKITIAQIKDGPRVGEFLFSSQTVQSLHRIYKKVKHLSYKSGTSSGFYESWVKSNRTRIVQNRNAWNRLKPVDTATPRSTLEGFLYSVNQAYKLVKEADAALNASPPTISRDEARQMEKRAKNQLSRAVHTLDLSHVSEALRADVGVVSALQLKEILDRMELPPIDTIPDAQMVAAEQTGKPSSRADEPVRWRFPNTEIEIVEIMDGHRQGQFLFSADSVDRMDDYYNKIKDIPYRMFNNFEYISSEVSEDFYVAYISSPDYLVQDAHFLGRIVKKLPARFKTIWGEQTLWQWIGFSLSLLVTILALFISYRFFRKLAGYVGSPMDSFLMIMVPIVMVVIIHGVIEFIDNHLNITGDLFEAVVIGGSLIIIAMKTWIVFCFCKAVGDIIITMPRIRELSSQTILLRTVSLVTGVLLGIVTIIKGLQNLGVDLVPLLAGLGISGIAVALAAQKTLANFISGLILLVNKPIQVGDFCRYGDQIGTIEKIGMITTRIRSLERILVTVPNTTLSDMQIENFTKRDQRLFNAVLQLRYETTPEQMRYILAKLRELLLGHPKVRPEPARVRFIKYNDYSKDLEIFAYLDCQDQNIFLAIQEDILLRIEEIIKKAGSGFAFPSQTAYLSRESGLDNGRRDEAENQVNKWRKSGKLPFPEFEEDESKRLENTLDYPPMGSPDYEPPEIFSDQQPPADSVLFSKDDFVDLPALVIKLQERNDLARYIRDQLSGETKKLLSEYGGGKDDKLKEALIQDVNAIILGPSIYDEQRFNKIELRQETLDLLSSKPKGDDLVMLNKLLWIDAFSNSISAHG